MKKYVFDEVVKVSFDNGETWKDTSFWKQLIYTEPRETTQIKYKSFKALFEAVKNDKIRNAYTSTALFTKKPKVIISVADTSNSRIVITEKNFSPILVENRLKLENCSMKTLASLLTADEFCEYLKDREIFSVVNI